MKMVTLYTPRHGMNLQRQQRKSKMLPDRPDFASLPRIMPADGTGQI